MTFSPCPFEEIARVLGRTPVAARQLASRARRRVQGPGQFMTLGLRNNAAWFPLFWLLFAAAVNSGFGEVA